MVVVGAWRRNDSRIGGLQDRIISNLDNEVLVATVTSPTAISKSIHGSFLKDLRRVSLKLNRIAYYNVSQFVNAQGFPGDCSTAAARSYSVPNEGGYMSHRWQ